MGVPYMGVGWPAMNLHCDEAVSAKTKSLGQIQIAMDFSERTRRRGSHHVMILSTFVRVSAKQTNCRWCWFYVCWTLLVVASPCFAALEQTSECRIGERLGGKIRFWDEIGLRSVDRFEINKLTMELCSDVSPFFKSCRIIWLALSDWWSVFSALSTAQEKRHMIKM